MEAQAFSKYLPFPLYRGRLMAFDVGGLMGLEVQKLGVLGWRMEGALGKVKAWCAASEKPRVAVHQHGYNSWDVSYYLSEMLRLASVAH